MLNIINNDDQNIGSKYVGTWISGKCEGAGEFIHANHRFQGNWTDGNVRKWNLWEL